MTASDDVPHSVVQRAATGERAAFDVLWNEYQPRLLRYLASLGCRDADDVASQAWLEVFQRLDLDDRQGSFRRLLFTIARRRMIDEVRRTGRHQRSIVDDAVVASAEDQVERTQAVIDLLAELPSAQAEVIALRVIVGLSAEEVGEITGRTAGAVRVMGHRGLQALRELMEPAEAESFDPYLVGE